MYSLKRLFSIFILLNIISCTILSCTDENNESKSSQIISNPGETSKEIIVTEFPQNNVSIGQHTKLIFKFNNPINISSTQLSGTLHQESNGGVWSSSKYTNDTLIISPKTSWTPGNLKTISISVINMLNTTVNFNYSYNVVNQVIYVSQSGADYNPGSQSQPKKTIQAAIKQAMDSDKITEIHVAQGNYAVNYQQGTDLKIEDGILLYGGYSAANWNDRNVELHETVIKDYSMVGKTNTPVTFTQKIKKLAVLDGFTIRAAKGEASICVKVETSAAKISNNRIILGNAKKVNYGIFLTPGISPIIEKNTITGTNLKEMYGIYSQSSSPQVTSNTIELYSNLYDSKIYCIYNFDSPDIGPTISKNKLLAKLENLSNSTNADIYGIYGLNSALTISQNKIKAVVPIYYKNSSTAIINNLIIMMPDHSTYAIKQEKDPNNDNSGIILNNTIIGDHKYDNDINTYALNSHEDMLIHNNISTGTDEFCPSYISNPQNITNNNITTALSLPYELRDKNISLNTLFTNTATEDYSLCKDTSARIAEGGLDGIKINWLFNYDFNGKIRTGSSNTGWSMGAFEFDGASGVDYEKDVYENDDSFTTAKEIIHGTSQVRSLHLNSDVDYIKFNVSNLSSNYEQKIIVYSQTLGVPCNFAIYDSNFQLVSSNSNSSLISNRLAAGIYYIKVYTTSESYEYNISLSIPSDMDTSTDGRANDNTYRATPLAFNTIIYGSLRSDDLKDYYKINVVANQKYAFKILEFEHDLDVVLRTYRFDDWYYDYVVDKYFEVNTPSTVEITFSNTGEQYISIDRTNNTHGLYTLEVTPIP